VAALIVVGALALHTTAVGLRAHARLRDRTLSGLRQAAVQARPRLAEIAAPGGPDVLRRTAAAALDVGPAVSAEVFDPDGTLLAAVPDGTPSRHWPSGREMARLRAGEVVAATQLAGAPPRVFSYLILTAAQRPVVLRLASRADDLVADLRDRQETFVAQALGLLLVLATVALVAPPRPDATAPPVGLIAYEEAMGRLRARDQELARQHQVERRRMEGELRDNAPFVRAGELTVGIVHEIRNGLGTILGYARLVQAAGGPAADHARAIAQECDTLEAVIRRFMEFVKDDALHPAPFDLGRMLSRVVAREWRGEPGPQASLPQGEVGLIDADEDLLERAFENLVRNARDAAGRSGQVWIDVERGRDAVLVTVADDGPGMPADVRSRLRPFFTTKSGGLGLGLPLAYKIVRQHGGDLMLADRPPRGLAVRVRLPLARSAESGPVTEGNPEEEETGVTKPTSTNGNTVG
jgi:signal transduction histidine kinase